MRPSAAALYGGSFLAGFLFVVACLLSVVP